MNRKVLLTVLLLVAGNAGAAQLKGKYRDENNDLICVYDSHGHKVYVNRGFSGHCSFSVSDGEL